MASESGFPAGDSSPGPAPVSEDQAAWNRALRFLAARPRTRREVSDKLTALGFSEKAVGRTVKKLAALAIVDDAAYAHEFAAQAARRGLGDAEIRRKLAARGIAQELAMVARDAVHRGDEQRALDLASKVSARYGHLPPAAAFRRLSGYLARKGYDSETVFATCNKVLGDFGESD